MDFFREGLGICGRGDFVGTETLERLGVHRIGEGEIVSTVLTQLVRSFMGCRILGRRGRCTSCSIGLYASIPRVSVSALFEKNNGTNPEKVLHCFQNSALIEKKSGTTDFLVDGFGVQTRGAHRTDGLLRDRVLWQGPGRGVRDPDVGFRCHGCHAPNPISVRTASVHPCRMIPSPPWTTSRPSFAGSARSATGTSSTTRRIWP